MLRASGRPPTLWLQILLVGGLVSVVIVLMQVYRTQRSTHVMAERAMRDYAHFAAWSYREHLIVRFREVAGELLGAVNHGEELHLNPEVPDVTRMGDYLMYDTACVCHRVRYGPLPSRFIGFTLGSDTVKFGRNAASPERGGWRTTNWDGEVPAIVPPNPDEARKVRRVVSDLGRRSQSEWGYGLAVTMLDSEPHLLGVRSMPTSWGDTLVYAFDHAPDAFRSILATLFASGELLPSTVVAGRRNSDVFDIEVTAPDGTLLYNSDSLATWDLGASASLPESFGGLRIRAQLRPAIGEAILIGGVPESRVPILLVILGLASGLTLLAAIQLRREIRFAAERATFVANVSHELRTPLAQVRLVLDTVRLGRAGDASARDRSLTIADREVLRLQHLVDGLLRFTRGPRRNGTGTVLIDAASEARAVVAEFEPLARQQEVSVEVSSDEKVPVELTNGAFRQVLLNLLDNAVKYGGIGGTVRITVTKLSGGGVRLVVDDSGPGIPVRERKRVWRSFHRGDNAREHAVGGSGIGLTIVREIAEEHHGKAEVADAPGGGARFVITMRGAQH